ncbi:Glycosyltransferase, probably involved in cell wall biogenesis [Methanocella conradii HZ254]|uniref:Glycosyltransferase, probably involved in cell wall biogenesis n=1 Tax=Methanocella conradii (strain DSM 24694 / JCM 17849 / CGMCC 1.5162 / HZ254) TaxID=1041930 RepID=H8IA56_METCZ|nr:glycosyltransferase [Methanocella conradii]AFC99122.1 Glycosyltransferase, probably involved in cell wall biogenesis [Methanocella conradii HZ254]
MDISVIIPTYNEEKYIETCLRSLKCQDFSGNYEVIVSDGSSTDATVEIACKYADRVIVDRKDTIAYGRQVGSMAARYPVLAFTDADTFIPSDWLSSLAASLEDSRVVGVHGKLLPLDGNRFEQEFCNYVLPPFSRFMVQINKPSVPGSNFAVRRRAFNKVKGFNTKLVTGEDVDLCNRIKSLGRFVYNPDAVVYVSTRRVRQWGYLKMLSFYTANTIRYHTFGSVSKYFEPIR